MSDRFQRELLRGSLDLIVLSVLADGAKYGYLLQKQIRQASSSRVQVEAGTLYPLLHRLEKGKLIRSKWDSSTGRRRKWYELTALQVGSGCSDRPVNGITTPNACLNCYPPRCHHQPSRLEGITEGQQRLLAAISSREANDVRTRI